MSDKRFDNHTKPRNERNAVLDAELLDAEATAAPGTERRKGDRDSHRAAHQPRPATPSKG